MRRGFETTVSRIMLGAREAKVNRHRIDVRINKKSDDALNASSDKGGQLITNGASPLAFVLNEDPSS
jgi:hypothetical protein